MRGAVIGYGFIASTGHIPAYLERRRQFGDVEIVAIADICEARRQLASRQVPGVRVYPDAQSLFQSEVGNLDFIDIATPPNVHAHLTLLAHQAGLHVLCEKPLAISVQQAREMLASARQHERVLFPCHNYKHAPVVKAIRDVLQRGCIGRVHSLTLNTFRNTHAKGVPEWNTDWRREKKSSGGGIAMDHGSHTFYLAFDWLGGYPTAVTAKISMENPLYIDTEDNMSATLTFPSGLAHVHLTWTAGVRKVIYTIQGELGAITVDDDDMQLSLLQPAVGLDVAQGAARWETERRSVASDWMDASHAKWFNALISEFFAAIARGDYTSRETIDSCLCVQLIMAVYQSAADKCREIALTKEFPLFNAW